MLPVSLDHRLLQGFLNFCTAMCMIFGIETPYMDRMPWQCINVFCISYVACPLKS